MIWEDKVVWGRIDESSVFNKLDGKLHRSVHHQGTKLKWWLMMQISCPEYASGARARNPYSGRKLHIVCGVH
jgi:hypothetical protein